MTNKDYDKILISLIIGLFIVCPPLAAQAAGFDCSKATTKVEKIICEDAGLSELDEELAEAYPEAIKKAPDPAGLKQQQQGWLKERNGCKDIACMKDQYQLRIGELNRIISLVLTTGQESHYFEKEADKLKVMQDIMRRQAFSHSPSFSQESEFCSEFMKDFFAGRNIVVVEPDFRSNDKDDPRFARFNRCLENHPERPAGEGDFYVIRGLGGPPYRYYHIDVDGNPENGKEDVVYHESDGGGGDTGYTWIDPKTCSTMGGGGVQDRLIGDDMPHDIYRLNILVLYKEMPVVLELYPARAPTPTKYRFHLFFNRNGDKIFCAWAPVSSNVNTDKTSNSKNNGGK